MRTFRLFIIITMLTFLAGAVPAFAQFQPKTQEGTDPCANATTADECMWSPMGTTGSGGSYTSCTASASASQTCQAQLRNSWGDLECVGVYRSGFCSCNASGATGSCSYVR
jgi:hypothetical protein